MAQTVRITPLEYNPQNALLNVKPLNDAFERARKANEFDATQQYRYDALDQQGAEAATRRGLEERRVGLAERQAASGEERRVGEMLGNVATTIDGLEGPARSRAWSMLVSSHPRMSEMLRRYGQDPADDVTGPKFIIAQTIDPMRAAQAEYYRAQARNQTRTAEEASTAPQYRINDQGELERADPPAAGPRGFVTPAAMRMPNGPAIAGPQQDVVPAQSTTADTTSVPGITLNRPISPDRVPGSREREQDAAALWPRIQAQDRTLTTPEINRAWTGIWGRQPRAGHIYNIRGQEVPNSPPDANDRGTRMATAATIQEALTNVRDAREVLSNSNYVSRSLQQQFDVGPVAQAMPVFEIASRAIMHGLSGAQVNIPETEAYLRAFMPRPWERWDRVEGKLAHMEGILGRINMRQGGAFTEEDKLFVRNQMRKAMGLRQITLDEHQRSMRPTNQLPDAPPAPGEQPPVPRTRQRSSNTDNPLQDMTDQELLRRLQGR
ncbi:MAG: hypothetical protein K2X43_01305 [Hyphomonadaceae bacterium]|jgi:hypothetical protein|nr:hypothetical protein [Hyphomonadaceae bacterium]